MGALSSPASQGGARLASLWLSSELTGIGVRQRPPHHLKTREELTLAQALSSTHHLPGPAWPAGYRHAGTGRDEPGSHSLRLAANSSCYMKDDEERVLSSRKSTARSGLPLPAELSSQGPSQAADLCGLERRTSMDTSRFVEYRCDPRKTAGHPLGKHSTPVSSQATLLPPVMKQTTQEVVAILQQGPGRASEMLTGTGTASRRFLDGAETSSRRGCPSERLHLYPPPGPGLPFCSEHRAPLPTAALTMACRSV
ncbi:hypothetical protein TREES_T100007871 [Tupaia chinensis]|uniref:Uncharacterized protein n=1 Tax=Tupaia chinensis TaxID=246437 RepID=L9JDT3_TUPCH|nr:hypothetical protein TREES_T100007871 [Tupaia chinensis]